MALSPQAFRSFLVCLFYATVSVLLSLCNKVSMLLCAARSCDGTGFTVLHLCVAVCSVPVPIQFHLCADGASVSVYNWRCLRIALRYSAWMCGTAAVISTRPFLNLAAARSQGLKLSVLPVSNPFNTNFLIGCVLLPASVRLSALSPLWPHSRCHDCHAAPFPLFWSTS